MRLHIPFLELGRLHESLRPELEAKFTEILRVGVFSSGHEVESFAREVSRFLGVKYAIPCSNGTDALEMALKVVGVKPGDEVIVPALSWISTAEAVVNIGAVPQFAEVDRNGLLDLNRLDKGLSERTKAIIPVHLYGKMVDMAALTTFARSMDLRVVEDAAQAFGAFQSGIPAGGWGDVGCFSFYPTKNLGALGEAGLLVTSDSISAENLSLFLNHGQPKRDEHEISGRNAKIDTLQAAFLRIKLKHFESMQERRKKLAAIYLERLGGLSEISLPMGMLQADHNAHLFTIQCVNRDQLKAYMEERGIGTAIHYPEILPHLKPFLEGRAFPVASTIARSTLSLPLNPSLREEEVHRVCDALVAYFQRG
ncbi:DegT/DnrJ/EryC1/StrS family aminotransferase [Lunatimonas salinarum]|uniref:DegT/DnrJ/EryC1/StrS family aminotransferase n=1 Tax=Lunatimonas salinarum TaxID=1774590 RepID=UPI001ADFFFF5|nr:DegT/DnrJ/EryC1/StrS family aminotransferase [Lunatimonas salinarum]